MMNDISDAVANLLNVISNLESYDDCQKFFYDICTVQELKAISQRLEVARLLNEEKTYNEVAEKTGASTATISRVNRSLNYGNGGYKIVFGNKEN